MCEDIQKTYRLTELVKGKELLCIIEQIQKICEIIDSKIINRKVEYYYKDSTESKQKKLVVEFKPDNIMHLLGISYYYKRELASKRRNTYSVNFYRGVIKGEIEYSNVWVESIEKVQTKLKALGCIYKLLDPVYVRVGKQGTLSTIKFDSLIRTNKKELALTLVRSKGVFVPQGCINLSVDTRIDVNKAFRSSSLCTKIVIYIKNDKGTYIKDKTLVRNKEKNTKRRKNKIKN